MTTQEIKDLMEKMSQTGLTLLEWETEGSRLHLERSQPVMDRLSQDLSGELSALRTAQINQALAADASARQAAHVDAAGQDSAAGLNGQVVTSPVVGIYYASPSPDSDPFIRVGCTVETGSPLCIIEAMKLMNEVTSPWDGIVSEIMVENGQRVEFGQPMFRIETSERT